MKNVLTMAVVLVVALCMATAAQAEVLFYEGFEYEPGPLAGNVNPNGSTWTPSGDNQFDVIPDSLVYPGLVTTGGAVDNVLAPVRNKLRLNGQAWAQTMAVTPGTYYWTVIRRGGTQQVALEGWLDNHSYLDDARIQTALEDGQEPLFRYEDVGRPDDSTHFIAIRLVNNGVGQTDTIHLVVDPVLPGEPDWANDAAGYLDSYDLSRPSYGGTLRVGGGYTHDDPAYDGDGYVDEIRFATTWAEAAPVPEPATLCLLGLGGLALVRRRR